MAEPIKLAVYIGTTREKRESAKAARWVADFAAQKENVEVKLVDPKDFYFPGDGNDPEGKDARYTEIVAWADAFFIVTPEYNHSFPGSLKRMLDSELKLYNHKPVAFAGASNGNWGGARAVESLLTAIRETGLVAMSWDVYFPYVQKMFNDDSSIKAEYKERYEKNVGKLLGELLWFAAMLKTARAEKG
jgi:NAD(P)H-dependent FMN reductase